MESTSKIRRHENTSSSEEDDLVDLLGNTCQVILKSFAIANKKLFKKNLYRFQTFF